MAATASLLQGKPSAVLPVVNAGVSGLLGYFAIADYLTRLYGGGRFAGV